MDVVSFVRELTVKVVAISWSLFLFTWSVGWALRGAPIPILRLKRTGQDLVEDSVWAAFWLAMGSTIFAAVSYLASVLALEAPPPPT